MNGELPASEALIREVNKTRILLHGIVQVAPTVFGELTDGPISDEDLGIINSVNDMCEEIDDTARTIYELVATALTAHQNQAKKPETGATEELVNESKPWVRMEPPTRKPETKPRHIKRRETKVSIPKPDPLEVLKSPEAFRKAIENIFISGAVDGPGRMPRNEILRRFLGLSQGSAIPEDVSARIDACLRDLEVIGLLTHKTYEEVSAVNKDTVYYYINRD